MTEKRSRRGPQVFDPNKAGLDLPPVETNPSYDAGRVLETVPKIPRKRGLSWTGVFATGFGVLISLALGLVTANLIEALFARASWLGYVGLGAAGLALLALLVILIREIAGMRRLARIAGLRADADAAAEADDRRRAEQVLDKVTALYVNDTSTARGRGELAAHRREVIDGRDLIKLGERALMTRKDAEARVLILGAAKRVTAVTAISPRALVDVLYVLFETLRLIRKLSELYGGRPSGFGMIRLVRMVLGHLAITGGIALTDSLVQQLLGHGLAARLSARLGEGVVNGLLTARIGLAALDVCRPLPYLWADQPALKDIMNELLRFGEKTDKDPT
ncbi:MAG: TIGR01620 family protein [Pseudomonadota bacterium]